MLICAVCMNWSWGGYLWCQIYEKQLYGPIYKVSTGSRHSITLNSVELVEELLRKDDKFPSRGDMSLWTEFRDIKDIGYGPFTE